jgi:hypothetical protein
MQSGRSGQGDPLRDLFDPGVIEVSILQDLQVHALVISGVALADRPEKGEDTPNFSGRITYYNPATGLYKEEKST